VNDAMKRWSHPRKRAALVQFVGFSLVFALSLWLCFFFPVRNSLLLFVVMALSLCVAAFSGYRAFFFSDDWFRAQEEKESLWWYEHPRLRKGLWVMLLLLIAYLYWKQFFR